MSPRSAASLVAVLGPTNTGKTHLAIERMVAHSSGVIGFPLRLLAREVYDRVVAMKGVERVALLTGEEKILPPDARWFLCTAESMPLRARGGQNARDFAFCAIDEVQLASDPERGHIFTDRMLHARGREETMLLGSDSMAPLVRSLLPDAEIISRPRFSTLSYVGARKLSRLPKRSAIVAFSAEEVYAVAEMLRRFRGGAAVVMGALSPRTRNAQVAMFQSGEVDYLVATDAIGMGLNMDVAHVAFASLSKFDGTRLRRLTVAEMAQIAGRAGRHQRDGTFGTLGSAEDAPQMSEEDISRIEEHRFPPVDHLYWRNGDPDLRSLESLIATLEDRPDRPGLRPAPEAIDLAVLRRLADDPEIRARARGEAMVSRLWDACSIPDFEKLGPEHHARLVRRIWGYLSSGTGRLAPEWVAQSIARLDNVQGDIATLSGRIAAARTWSYVAHRSDWLIDPGAMAARATALEERLSDALHSALVQRFVDRRTTVLLRDVGKDVSLLPVRQEPDGAIMVDDVPIGQLIGFRFVVDSSARASDRRLLLAAAERRLGGILNEKLEQLCAAADDAFSVDSDAQGAVSILWDGIVVAALVPGPSLIRPSVRLDRSLLALGQDAQRQALDRVNRWLAAQFEKHLPALIKMQEAAEDAQTPPTVRSVLVQLIEQGGVMSRRDLDPSLAAVSKEDRGAIRKLGITIGVMDVYHLGLIKPGAAHWRMTLLSMARGKPVLPLPAPGLILLASDGGSGDLAGRIGGFRRFADSLLRIDMAERIARQAHEAIEKDQPFRADMPSIVSTGLPEPAFLELMRQAGFRPITPKAKLPVEPDAPSGAEAPEVSAAPGDGSAAPEEGSVIPAVALTPDESAPETPQVEVPTAAMEATGANWAFRGRPKAAPRPEGRGRDQAGRNQVGRGQDRRPSRGPSTTATTEARSGAVGGSDKGPKEGQRRDDRGAKRGPRPAGREAPPPAKPATHGVATGKAFADLAALLGRTTE